MQTSRGKYPSAFSWWLRTGRLPVVGASGEIEFKFNPWHDPQNGQFTFAGSGQYRSGGTGPSDRVLKPVGRDGRRNPGVATGPKTDRQRAWQLTSVAKTPQGRSAGAVRPKPIAALRPGDAPNPAAEFVGGVSEGLYGVARGTIAAAHSALTTNPVTTARNVGRGIASAIDTVMAAEDTPAAIQVSRAADAIAKASAREIGRATGSVVGNAAMAVAPGAVVGKVSALRRLRGAVPRPTYDPPQIGWVKENLTSGSAWKAYNDSATGARPGQAPTLMRTMPDGSERPVKFDGVEGDYVIDRKWKVVTAPRARKQLLRQSEVLARHRLIGTWEVPSEHQRIAAHKLLKKMNITNIKVRIVKP